MCLSHIQSICFHPLALATLLGSLVVSDASAQILISAGHWEFSAGTTEARINLRVYNNGNTVDLGGVDVTIQLDDGGISGGSASVYDVTLTPPGALFTDNSEGIAGAGSVSPLHFEVSTRTMPGTTVPMGNGDRLLAHITLDLSDMVPGDFLNVRLVSGNGVTRLVDGLGQNLDATLVDGRVQIAAVPENEAFVMVAGTLLFGLGVWRRCKG